jgi:DNA (cytosine-5)-methyltransferase 1
MGNRLGQGAVLDRGVGVSSPRPGVSVPRGVAAPNGIARKYGVIDLFAGIGCVARGFEQTGRFETIALNDVDRDAADTYAANFPTARYVRRDISSLRPGYLRDLADGRTIHGLLGCPPCQGFSAAGLREEDDERNRLLGHYFRLVKALRPPFVVMENVPRVFRYTLFQDMLRQLKGEYTVWAGVLNASLYGVPQTRQRAIVIGFRHDLGVVPMPPTPTTFGQRRVFEYATRRLVEPRSREGVRLLGLYPEVGHPERMDEAIEKLLASLNETGDLIRVGDAIGDLPPASDTDATIPYGRTASSAYASDLRGSEACNHVRWRHGKQMLRRLRDVAEGAGLLDAQYGRSRVRPYFSQAYTRLHRQGLARTVTTNFHNPGSGRFLHYRDLRTITVREAARLQGISDTFRFVGFQSVQERLVGNAFPVPLARAIAAQVASQLSASP